jgi:hypothetical protein
VCLKAGKTATKGKTKRGNRDKIGRKDEKIRTPDAARLKVGVFPQPLQSCRKWPIPISASAAAELQTTENGNAGAKAQD